MPNLATSKVLPLWPNNPPGALGVAEQDIPTLTIYCPGSEVATGAAMVVCPGGGYGMHSEHEGEGFAKWLSQYGILALVLKYRLGSHGYRHPVMLDDASRALRLVRYQAEGWNIDPARIGIMGSSAGGHLAATLLTHSDAGNTASDDPVERQSSRPDLGILCYPVITMGTGTHEGSRENLLGPHPGRDLIDFLSNEKHVTRETPPCFLMHTWEDDGVIVENSLEFAAALRKNKVRFEIHVYEKGGHGIGLGENQSHRWTHDCLGWLRERGFAAK